MIENSLNLIYDALEAEKPDTAMRECNRVLLKHPNQPTIKALKAFSLIKLGRISEAKNEAEEVLNSEKMIQEDSAIHALSLALQGLNEYEKLVNLYEKVSNARSNVEKYSREYFFACVKANDLKSQHSAVLQLQKRYPKRAYRWWTVTTIYLEYLAAKNDMEKKLHISLTQRLASKLVEEDPKMTLPELCLYLRIMREANELDKAIMAIEKNEGYVGQDPDIRIEFLKLLNESGQSQRAMQLNMKMMEKGSDNYVEYIEAIESLERMSKTTDQVVANKERESFKKNLKQWVEDPKRGRNAMLADLEYGYRVSKNDVDLQQRNLWRYINRFASKKSCFVDIQGYVELFSEKEKFFQMWTSQLEAKVEGKQQLMKAANANASLKNEKDLNEIITLEKLRWLTDVISERKARESGKKDHDHVKVKERTNIARANMLIERGSMLKGQEFLGLRDELWMIACQYLLKESDIQRAKDGNRSESDKINVAVLTLLEQAIETNSMNYETKLLAMKVYMELGVVTRTAKLYEALSIKGIQKDSLSYLILGHAIKYGQYSSEKNECLNAEKIYKMCRTKQSQRHTSQQQDDNDGGDDGLEYDSDGDTEYNNGHGRMMQMAYEQGSHHKVVEFYEFTERLEKSLQRNMTQVLMDASDLVLGKYGSGNNYGTDNSDWVSELYDNRDLSIVKKANYTNSVISSAVVQQFQQQTMEKDGGSMIFIPSKHVEWPESIKVKGWLKTRSCILGMLVEILQLGKTQNPDESQNQKIKEKLTKMIRRVDMDLRRVGSNDHDSSHVAKIYESKTIDQLINELGKHAYSDKCGIDQREEAFEVLYTKLVVGVAVLALQEGNESVEDSISVDIGEKVIWGHGMQGKEKSVQTFMEYVCQLICNYLSTHGPVDATQSNDQTTTDIPTCIRLLSLWAQVYSVLKKTTQADNLSSVKQLVVGSIGKCMEFINSEEGFAAKKWLLLNNTTNSSSNSNTNDNKGVGDKELVQKSANINININKNVANQQRQVLNNLKKSWIASLSSIKQAITH